MIKQSDLSGKLAFDTQSLGALKAAAHHKGPDALRGAATQFEAMFINMMMQSMRATVPQDGPTDSQETRTFTSMLDQQMSQKLAGRGMGLADMLVKQLAATQGGDGAAGVPAAGAPAAGDPAAGVPAAGVPAAGAPAAGAPAAPALTALAARGLQIGAPVGLDAASGAVPVSTLAADLRAGLASALGAARAPAAPVRLEPLTAAARTAPSHSKSPHIREFTDRLAAHAEEASRATGIPAKFMLGQAALESGWGRREIKNADGSASHNLFGIKAGKDWHGKTVSAYTTEYVHGVPHTRVEKFRAYDSYADGFKDYANLLANNPRYQKVLAHAGDAAGFARGLQQAGYATDPFYAAKLTNIINKHLLT